MSQATVFLLAAAAIPASLIIAFGGVLLVRFLHRA
jgi:hypothetical protein